MTDTSVNELPDDDPILTTRSAARLLGVAVSTAQQWIESGRIASWKTPGGHRRVRLSAVQKILEGNTPAPETRLWPAAMAPEFQCVQNPTYPAPDDESRRLRALAASGLIESAPEREFDRLTWLATRITQTPMALVSLLTSRRQWFKSRVGLDAVETPREWAFCSHAILNEMPLIVEDAAEDERFKNNPLVTGAPYLRFYAGFPLYDKDDYKLGTLCVLDQVPRKLMSEQIEALRELAAIASEEIKRRGLIT
ncbi:excisionase family DNA-binding protein [Noviherbaspirillum sp. CPCC 100848]|uniref:Excisionase family DNA-binding protein n=1 Tax=Noviherbaspirillum album TaxID=3080276 RepID=A0ABU6J319_9BURK|nr:GAF domain-containing protein [Noviherbaspirillum sp. CPCC 100848]MEC4718009.1 excisionase family DNA-binding protein [Noviherbaspirillum sp. CPCC 100848]